MGFSHIGGIPGESSPNLLHQIELHTLSPGFCSSFAEVIGVPGGE